MKVNKSINIQFEEVSQIDDRFVQVKIWLMHLGKNYNGSIFYKDVVVKALDSLKNTPILAYIEETESGSKDFRGHEMELIVEDGELKTRYIGSAYGVIPENCNPRFEFKEGDNGQLLEYLVVDGLLWTKFDEPISILSERGEVAQSMELHDEFDGYWDEDGNFVFTDFSFYGACLLGADVLPAMQKASVEQVFTASVIQDEIAKKLEEYQILLHSRENKEVDNQMKLEELLAKYETTADKLSEEGINVEDYTLEELEQKLAEMFSSEESTGEGEASKEGEVEKTEFEEKEEKEGGEDEGEENEGEEDKEVFTLTFELSHDDIRRELYRQLEGAEDIDPYIVAVYDSSVVYHDWNSDSFFKAEYTREGDNIVVGESIQVFEMYLTQEEKNALELMRSNYQKLEEEVETLRAENEELKEFKRNALEEEHLEEAEKLFAQFSKLEEEDIQDLRQNALKYSIEEIESKLYERLGRKIATKYQKQDGKADGIKIKVNTNNDESNSSKIDKIFAKYGKKPIK